MTPATDFEGSSSRPSTTDTAIGIMSNHAGMVPSSPTILRPAKASDAPALASLADELGYPTSAETLATRLQRILSHPGHCLLVAVVEPGGVVGWIHGFLSPLLESDFRVEIGGLVVRQPSRRQGVGTLLVRRIEEWGRREGAVEISVRCQIHRDGAHRFYEELGYLNVKTQHVFRRRLETDPPMNTTLASVETLPHSGSNHPS